MRNFLIRMVLLLFAVLPIACSEQNTPGAPTKKEVPDTHITLEQATDDLNKLLESLRATKGTRFSKTDRKIANAYTVNLNEDASRSEDVDALAYDFYVINFENEGGFAFMSSDERLPPLFMLTDSGNISRDEVITNPGLVLTLNMIEAEIGILVGSFGYDPNVVCPTKRYGEWENVVYGPQCKVKWNQLSPYNSQCKMVFEDNEYQRPAVGCVPLALAQLMSVYKYPPSNYNNSHQLCWDEMTKYPWIANVTETAQFQIPKLLADLGLPQHLDVDYHTPKNGGSSAHTYKIQRTLNAFGYQKCGHKIQYNNDRVIKELKNGHPVIVSGASLTNRPQNPNVLGFRVNPKELIGHCWLCHGLLQRTRPIYYLDEHGYLIKTEHQTLYYPLCNWGWGGAQDGYYLTNVFDPHSGTEFGEAGNTVSPGGPNYNFEYLLEAIVEIRPH